MKKTISQNEHNKTVVKLFSLLITKGTYLRLQNLNYNIIYYI